MSKKDIRVRFAPSPTGHLHIGGARTAMFNWLFARHHGGTYLLRVEDTDVQRSTKEYLDSQLDSLKWLGLMPDEPILHQLSRVEEHKKVVQELLDKKLAYPCFCDPKSIEEKKADIALQQQESSYAKATEDRGKQVEKPVDPCRDKEYTPEDFKRPHAIRFRLPQDIKEIEFDDAIRGKIKVSRDQLDDFVIMRRDGTPTYNFVVVLDDIFMKISHVIRGEDHISNTPKQILIYKALGATLPVFAHIPLILGPAGNKLSKRDAAVSVKEYMQQGFLSDALFNYLVRLGWSHGDQEIFTKDEMIKYFTLDHVGKKGAIFDTKKLEWLNGVYLRELSFEKFLLAVDDLGSSLKKELTAAWSQYQLKTLFEQYKQRATTLREMVQDMISLSHAPQALDLDLIKKWRTDKTVGLVECFLQGLTVDLSHETLVTLAKQCCEKFEMKLVALAQPLRLALVGKTVSPGVFELIGVLGIEESRKRIEFLIKTLRKDQP
jgi:glutamyl-tRNA synthetase